MGAESGVVVDAHTALATKCHLNYPPLFQFRMFPEYSGIS
jgi:hypothetical protein